MGEKRGQVALEQLVITGFVMVSVAIVFSVAVVNYEGSVQTAKANDALLRMVGKADEIYRLGEGHSSFVNVSFPTGTQELYVIHKCTFDKSQGANCPLGDNDINFSALGLRMNYIGGESDNLVESKAKLVLMNFDGGGDIWGSSQTIRIGWSGSGKIELRRV